MRLAPCPPSAPSLAPTALFRRKEEKCVRASQIYDNERRREKQRQELQLDEARLLAECKQKLAEEKERQVRHTFWGVLIFGLSYSSRKVPGQHLQLHSSDAMDHGTQDMDWPPEKGRQGVFV